MCVGLSFYQLLNRLLEGLEVLSSGAWFRQDNIHSFERFGAGQAVYDVVETTAQKIAVDRPFENLLTDDDRPMKRGMGTVN